MPSIEERYVEKFRRSGELLQKGQDLIPGGGHQSRAVRPHPVYIDQAKGAVKWDADGNELIDHMLGFGALILGNAHPVVTKAVARRLEDGTHMGTLTQLELRWAELVKSLIPSTELVRFTSSGTEATLLALRLSRGFTGKTKLVKFREHFHGWNDYVAPGSGITTEVGIPAEALSTVIVIEPDIAAFNALLAQDDDIAAVILEPTGGHWGQFPLPNPGFLEDLREITERHGVVMIMDEVICGFRTSPEGAQGRFNVRPDLTTMAKILAGGLPGAAVAGRADIMGLIGSKDPAKFLAHTGTFNANPISATAGIATLELIANEPINERADAMAARLKQGLNDALSRQEVAGHAHGLASIVNLALGVDCDCDRQICTLPHSDLAEAARPRAMKIKLAMLNEGVDTFGGIGFMVSAVHDKQQIDQTLEAFERALVALREDGVV